MKKVFIIIAVVLFAQSSMCQLITVQQYIEQHRDFAIREMNRMGVPAAITLAQGILETECGNSDLVKKSNNHFGIKCKSSWTSTGVSHDDDAQGECFRCYKDAMESYRDHSNFLRGNDRYAFLFSLDPKDYKGWAYGLKKAGYATNPNYPKILIKNIEDNNLQQYTLEAIKDIPVYDASKYTSDPEDKITDKAYEEITKTSAENANDNASLQFMNKIMINGATAIKANKGTSLLAIAAANNISLAKLLEYNDLENDGLLPKDQLVFLEKKSKRGERDFYILQKNESLYDAAQSNGISLQSLCNYNGLPVASKPEAGTKLLLKPLPTNDLAMNDRTILPLQGSGRSYVHLVQPKEGLYAISKKYGVTIAQIKEWNNLADDNLKIGQQLIVSVSK